MAVIGKVTNKQLIDSNALNERFDKRIKWLQLDMHDQYSLGLYHGAVTDKDLINEMPTVDAVEVIRCKDCRYYEIHKPKVLENCERNGYIIPMKPDGFCSYGERKEGAD